MTYQSELVRDRYANIALSLPAKYQIGPEVTQAVAYYLAAIGKGKTDDHLKQIAIAEIKKGLANERIER